MEKSYSYYMDSIKPTELSYGLLAYGLFAEKLPPIFSSVKFYDWAKKNKTLIKSEPRGYIYYESIRNVNIPRQLGIPNPFSYACLCFTLEQYWKDLQKYFKEITESHSYKISRIHIRKKICNESLFEMNYKNLNDDGDPLRKLSIGKKYVVKSDITYCYPSIYSHSISWALLGKDEAKKESSNKNLWTNIIDYNVRNIKHGETNGLLIGPHSSNLLSEIILTRVDQNLYEKGYRFIRNIDDYCCVTESYEQAESFINDLVSELKNFNLSVNQKKTEILKLPLSAEDEWVHNLGVVPVEGKYVVIELKSVKRYLDMSLQAMKDNNGNAAPINYAIKVLKSLNVNKRVGDYIVDTVLHWAIIYPYLLPLLSDYIFNCYSVDTSLIQEFASLLYLDSIKRNNYEGISYALFFCIKYNVTLTSLNCDDILEGDCISKLLYYLYCMKFNIKDGKKVLVEHAEKLLEFDMNEDWLFVYEVLNQESLRGKGLWINLKRNGVSFIKPEYCS